MALAIMVISFMAAANAASPAKQINNIKRAGTYFYAEATTDTEKESKSSATAILANHINDYIKDNDLSHERVDPDNIPGVKFITMKRGSQTRAFAYVEKGVILNGETPMPQPEIQVEPEPEPEQNISPDTIVCAPETTLPESQIQEEAISEQTVTEEILPDAPTDNSDVTITPQMQTYINALESLYNAGSIENVIKTLHRLEAEYIVKRYGAYTSCKNRTWSFWMIYDRTGKTLEAFLSPGQDGERLNIITNTENGSLEEHLHGKGKTAIFFEFR